MPNRPLLCRPVTAARLNFSRTLLLPPAFRPAHPPRLRDFDSRARREQGPVSIQVSSHHHGQSRAPRRASMAVDVQRRSADPPSRREKKRGNQAARGPPADGPPDSRPIILDPMDADLLVERVRGLGQLVEVTASGIRATLSAAA